MLPNQFRQWPVVADEVLGTAGEVGKLRAGDVNAQPLVERGEDIAEMNGPGFRLLAPAGGRAEVLAAPQFATLRTGALGRRIVCDGNFVTNPMRGPRPWRLSMRS